MRYMFIVLLFLLNMHSGLGQEGGNVKPNMKSAMDKMVLRPNTRDKKAIVHDNMRRLQVQKRKQMHMSQQKKNVMQRHKNQMQRQRIRQQQLHRQRKLRDQSVRKRQMQRR